MIRRKEKGILLTMVLTIAFFVMGINTVRAGSLALSAHEALYAAFATATATTDLTFALGEGSLSHVYQAYQQLSVARKCTADAYTYASYASGSGNAGTYAYYARVYANDALKWIEEAETYAYQAYTQNDAIACLIAINRTGLSNMYICTSLYNAGIGSVGGQH